MTLFLRFADFKRYLRLQFSKCLTKFAKEYCQINWCSKTTHQFKYCFLRIRTHIELALMIYIFPKIGTLQLLKIMQKDEKQHCNVLNIFIPLKSFCVSSTPINIHFEIILVPLLLQSVPKYLAVVNKIMIFW